MKNNFQLFCFTYAGGTASFFDTIENCLNNIEVVKLEYSGHGKRFNEPMYKNFDELANDMFENIKKCYKNEHYALFGYSMGTITLTEVLKRIIEKQTIPLPDYLFIAAHEPCTKEEIKGYSNEEINKLVKERTISFGGIPDKLINNKSFWRMYLPLYRADYSIIAKYRFEDLSLKSSIPTTIFYSETDTPYEKMKLWKKFFTGKCDYYRFEGKHFFIKEYCNDISIIIKRKIEEIYDI